MNINNFLVGILACALLAPPAEAARRPKNPRRAKKSAPAAASPAPAADTSAVPPEDRLPAGRWTPSVRAALESLIYARGKSSSEYDERRPPVAVLAWNHCALDGDPSEAVLHRLLARVELKLDDAFWREIPLGFGRQRARAAHQELVTVSSAAWSSQPSYRQFRKAVAKGYRDICVKVGVKECRVYLAELLKGFSADEALGYAAAALSEESARRPSEERYVDEEGDPDPVIFRRGLMSIPELEALARLLRARGFDVWALSPDAQPILEASVQAYGIDPTRAVGIAQGVVKTALDGKALEPVPVRGGAVEAVSSRIGRAPDLTVGCRAEHTDLLAFGSGTRLVLERGDPGLRALAAGKDWLHESALPAQGRPVR